MNKLINILQIIFENDDNIFISNNSIIKLVYGNTNIIELETEQNSFSIFLKINKHNFFNNIKIKKNTIFCDEYIIQIILPNINNYNITIKNMKYDIKNKCFINKCSKIYINNYNDLLINSLQCIDIFILLSYDIEIDIELLDFVKNNSDLIASNLHKRENYCANAIPQKLYQIENIKNFIQLIKINTFLHKLLFNNMYDENLYNIINPTEIYELYAIIIIQHFKYETPIVYEKLTEKTELNLLLNSKNDTKTFVQILKLYDFKKYDYENLKEINYLFYILNIKNVSMKLKMGYILKNYYLFDIKNIMFCINFYNYINNDTLTLYNIIEDTKYYVLIEMLNIPLYKKNKKMNIIDFQNSFIFFYKYIFETLHIKNKKIDYMDYDKIMKKSIKKIKQLLYYEFDIIK